MMNKGPSRIISQRYSATKAEQTPIPPVPVRSISLHESARETRTNYDPLSPPPRPPYTKKSITDALNEELAKKLRQVPDGPPLPPRRPGFLTAPTVNRLAASGPGVARMSTTVTRKPSSAPALAARADDASVHPYASATYGSQPREEVRQLFFQAQEIYEKEKAFVAELDSLIQLLDKADRVCNHTGHEIAQEVTSVLYYLNHASHLLGKIREVHTAIEAELRQRIHSWVFEKPDLASSIEKYARHLKVCLPFLEKKNAIVNAITKAMGIPEIKSVLESGSRLPLAQRLDIVHQNVSRYRLLLQDYKKCLVAGSEEFINTESALFAIRNVMFEVNKHLDHSEKSQQQVDILKRLRIDKLEPNPDRVLIRHGDVSVLVGGKQKPRYLILFSDVLLITKSSADSKDPITECDLAKIENISVYRQDHIEKETQFMVETSDYDNQTFVAKTKAERDKWFEELESTASKASRKRYFDEEDDDGLGDDASSDAAEYLAYGAGSHPSSTGYSSYGSSSGASSMGYPSYGTHAALGFNPTGLDDFQKPMFIPEQSTSMCMMQGCSTKFGARSKKQRCKQCRWIMCERCTGKAPYKRQKMTEFKVGKVCPPCYEGILETFYRKKLFPKEMIDDSKQSDPSSCDGIRVRMGGRLYEWKDLFDIPKGGLRPRISLERDEIVSGKVFMNFRYKVGAERERWGSLRRDPSDAAPILAFYEAERDDKPVLEYPLSGARITYKMLKNDEILFKYRKGSTNARFRVTHPKSAERWRDAFREYLRDDCVNDFGD